ncbi:MAG TPA: Ger(x)C family spore germination protein [Pseudoflavonifractor sp.]|nr:Ger(x)C family spore germination protein [Pseudoflavonifractor sp.]
MKHPTVFLSLLLCCALLSGCWNYRGLDEIDIVTGIAVDRVEESGSYRLTIEIVDTQDSETEGGVNAKYVEIEGETLFDAIRNSKRRLINKLYGGNMQALIISRQIAEEEGVSFILEELLRDGEPRETMSVVISQEATARDILLTDGIDSKIISYEIHDMIREDSKVTASTISTPLYQAYNAIRRAGGALALPAVHCTQNQEKTVAEGNGIALFHGDRLQGFLSVRQAKSYLFLIDKLEGGVLSFPVRSEGREDTVSMEIQSSKTRTNVEVQSGQLSVDVSVRLKLNLTEVKSLLSLSDTGQRESLERLIEDFVQASITEFFAEIQTRYKTDVLGLGRLLYQKDPDRWRSLESQWDELFQKARLSVRVKADILTAGVLKNY